MTYLLIKLIVSALIIVAVSEIAQRSSLWGGILASLPLTSILAMIWLYRDTGSQEKVVALSYSIATAVLPSITLFIVFPILMKKGMGFYLSLFLSALATSATYGLFFAAVKKVGSSPV